MRPSGYRKLGSELLERDVELRALDELAAAAVAGRGYTMVVEGQAGLGKSRLLAAGAHRAADGAGLAVAPFACGELEGDLAWSGALGLLGAATDGLTPKAREKLLTGAAAPVARLLADPAGSDREGELDPFALIHGIYVVIERLAQSRPLLLLLDDAHWSDPQSLRLILYLARRLGRLPAGLVLAARPRAAAEQRQLLDSIAAGPDVRSYRLRPLTVAAVTRLVRHAVIPDATDTFCATCRRITAGNPFYLEQILSTVADRARETELPPDALLENLPESISRSILIRLRRTPLAHAAELAQAVSVLGDVATLAHAAALAGLDHREAADIVDALVKDEILRGGEPLRFVHPLVRAAVYADTPAARRSQLHRVAADVLERDHAGPELVGMHLLHVPRAAAADTITRLRAAAVAARRHGAPAAAVRYLRRALAEPPSPEVLGAVLLELADAESQNGDPAAVEHLQAALEIEPPQRHARILLALGWAQHHAGRFGLAAETFEQGMLRAGADEPDLQPALEAGYLQSATLDAGRAADAAARIGVIELAFTADRDPATRDLLAQMLFGRTMYNDHRDRIVDLALRLWSDGRLLQEEGAGSQTVWHVVGALSWADAGEMSREISVAVLAAAEEEGNALAEARGRYALSWVGFWEARLDEAAADARQAVDLWFGGLEVYLPAAVHWLILSELERDDLAAAEQAFALNSPVERWDGSGMEGFVAASAGHLAAHRGDAQQALAHQLRCGRLMSELQIVSPAVMPWRSEAAAMAALAGDRRLGAELAQEELRLARPAGIPRATGRALRVAALFAEPGEQVGLLEESVKVLEGSGALLELARSHVELGSTLRRAGHRRAARPSLRRGLEIAGPAGAKLLAAQARTELRAAGARVIGESADGPGVLTASERRVAELAAAGHANRDIAARLQVSIKGVEWHLSQSYRKLGISGRRQLAAALASPDAS
jgi:DNA-binding CsgD family transcriptional regulator